MTVHTRPVQEEVSKTPMMDGRYTDQVPPLAKKLLELRTAGRRRASFPQ